MNSITKKRTSRAYITFEVYKTEIASFATR